MLRRSRALAGLRELPTFVWLYPLGEIRRQLLLAGEELADRGTIHEADDVMFLTLSEAAEAAAGMDYRAEAASRRANMNAKHGGGGSLDWCSRMAPCQRPCPMRRPLARALTMLS
jgi:hypothetical protein